MHCRNRDLMWVVPFTIALTSYSGAQTRPSISERVDVGRVLIDARVTDSRGRPVPDLLPGDFIATIDGRLARIDGVEWHGNLHSRDPRRGPAGRLYVLFVQLTLNGNVARRERDVIALTKALQSAEPIVAGLHQNDRIAIVSFDQHLKVWTDFTNDVDLIRDILHNGLLTAQPTPLSPSADVSLFTGRFQKDAASAYTMEDALACIGNALRPITGPKTVLLLGYGFGRPDALKRSLVEAAALPGILDERFKEAVESVVRSRTSVITIDVTEASRHTLEAGLQALSEGTGGLYVRGYPFMELAIKAVEQSLQEFYTLSVERPEQSPGEHRVQIRLIRHGYRVHAPTRYFD
jgi:VWFA-related protein